jgi:hypothetical protein
MDEKGFLLGVLKKMKRVFTKCYQDSGRLRGAGQDGSREWITLIATICMDGTTLDPSVIYQSDTCQILDTWLEDFDPEEHSCNFISSPTGWTNDEIGLAWLQSFDRGTKAKARNGRDPRLLLLDGHNSHINQSFLDYAAKRNIHIAIYPPHSTHRLQPLDIGLFLPLTTFYSQNLDKFILESRGLTAITKRNFFYIFWPAFQSAFSEKNVLNAWKKAGLQPFDPQSILQQVEVSSKTTSVSRPNTSSTSSSVTPDYRKIRALIIDATSAVLNEKLDKVILKYHQLQCQNELLEAENNDLKKAFYHEKKKRRRGKPLQLQTRDGDEDKATFLSPAKIQTIRRQQQHKDEEKQAEEQARAEKKRLQQEKKEREAQAIAQRRQDRALKKAEKDRQKEEQKLQKDANTQLKTEQKRQGKQLKSPLEQAIVPRLAAQPFKTDVVAGGVEKEGLRPRRQVRKPQHLQDYEL